MNLQTVLIIIIAFGLGYAFAMLDRRVTTGMKDKRDEAKKQPTIVEKVVPEKSALSLQLEDPAHPRLRMDGVPLTPGQVTPDQRKRLIGMLNMIRPWVDAAPAPPVSPTVSAPQADVARNVAGTGGMAVPLSAAQEPAPSLDVGRGFRAMMYNAVITEEPAQGTGIVKQIDDILQQKLPASPYADRHIHLEEGAGGEVLVLIGAQKFHGIDAVPDRGIQGLIREAIGEWERRGGR